MSDADTFSQKADCQFAVQGYLTSKKPHPPRTRPWADAQGPRGVLEGWAFSYGRGTPVVLARACEDAYSTLWPLTAWSTWRYQDRYMGTSLIRNCFLLGPYSRPMARALWWS